MNVLLIVIDTLRADHVHCYGYPLPTSPHLDALAARGTRATWCFGDTNCTDPNFTTIFTGKHVLSHNVLAVRGHYDLPASVPWLPTLLVAAGYRTLAADNLTEHKPWFCRDFQDYRSTRPAGKRGKVTAEHVQAQALQLLDEQARSARQPFFLFVHYWDPHQPYQPPPEHQQFYAGHDPRAPNLHALDAWQEESGPWAGITDPAYLTSLYDGEVHHADAAVGELLARLTELGFADDTCVIVTGDHGEIMDRPYRPYYGRPDHWCHRDLTDGTVRVPLLFAGPGVPAGRTLDGFVVQADIAPTILEWLGQGHLVTSLDPDGISLLPALRGEALGPDREGVFLCEDTYQLQRGWRTRDWKYLARQDALSGVPPRGLWHLATDADEHRNVVDVYPEVAAMLEARLHRWVRTLLARRGKPDPRDLQQVPAIPYRKRYDGLPRAGT